MTMPPGTYAPARRRAASVSTRATGGFIFAEDPAREAPAARIIWHADLDPRTISALARPADPANPDSVSLERLAPWLQIADGEDGIQHAVLTDGRHHLRLDVTGCPLSREHAVLLRYHVDGLTRAERQLASLHRFLAFCRHGQFHGMLFRPEPGIARRLEVLRVHDALASGASQRDIAAVLFGFRRTAQEWNGPSDWLRSRVRRLVREARTMAGGGYRRLLARGDRTAPKRKVHTRYRSL